MGVKLEPVTFPDSGVYNANLISIVLNAESAAAFDELTRTNRDDLIERQDKDFWPNSFRSARLIPAVEYINANRYRYALSEKVQEFMNNYDVVITPTFAGGQLAITNLTGNPVVCMPIGFNKSGAPLSITLIGKLYDEASILEAAKAYQDKTDHHKKHPELFAQALK
jgi:Asp-tRNA(Asn)/Glu-tRNA(Gln) amidotransferase A subunit family amidase